MKKEISLEQYLEKQCPSWVLKELDAPRWQDHDQIMNWRNYVPNEIRKIWNKLSRQDKLLVAWMCEEKASSEEWD